MDILREVFGISSPSIEALKKATEFAKRYVPEEEFLETLSESINWRIRTNSQENIDLHSVFETLPTTVEGWISEYIDYRVAAYDSHTTGPYGTELDYLAVEREEWDSLPSDVRNLTIAYFKELINALESLVIIDKVHRGNKLYTYHNGRLHKVEELSWR